MDKNSKLVHLKTETKGTPAQFVSVERHSEPVVRWRHDQIKAGDRYFVFSPWLDAGAITEILADINKCDVCEIDLKLDMDLWLTVTRANQEMSPARWEQVGRS